MKFEQDVCLKKWSTFGIGGKAKYFYRVVSITDLQDILHYCNQQRLRYLIIGKASNILFDDRGYNGVVILNKISFFQQYGNEVFVGSGYSFSLLGHKLSSKGLTGLEFAAGIPGTVGGAIYMNAGANGQETFQMLKEVTFVDETGEVRCLSKDQLEHGYRFSIFQKNQWGIAAGRFLLKPYIEAPLKKTLLMQQRQKTQPYRDKSAGCVFRNLETSSAGALIDRCGLKGYKIGDAEVSPIHANFIVNKASASAQNILDLIEHVSKIVYEKTGYVLEKEIKFIPYE